MTKAALLVSLLPALVACGGRSSPGAASQAPTAPQGPVVLTLASGETGQPIAGAAVTVEGRPYSSDAGGRVAVDGQPNPNALVDIVAPGFLDRQTLYRPAATRYALWPRSSATGLDEEFTARIVYTSASSQGDQTRGAEPLFRLRPSATSVVIVLDASVSGDGPALTMHEQAVAEMNGVIKGGVRYSLASTRPASGTIFDARLDPSHTDCGANVRAFVNWSLISNEITGGSIVYCLSDAARSTTVLHELGHTFGLRHSPDSSEVMAAVFMRNRNTSFAGREVLAMALLLERRGGNRFPDNDREATATAFSGQVRISCR